MEQIPISKFKATCLSVVRRVRQTGEPIIITRFGKPIAELSRPSRQRLRRRELGRMAGTLKIVGDIVGPIGDASDWNALR
ncbi:MAG: type II toxin-antitoxin system Phd/YefM family antitoxin [Terriglobales bacterium]